MHDVRCEAFVLFTACVRYVNKRYIFGAESHNGFILSVMSDDVTLMDRLLIWKIEALVLVQICHLFSVLFFLLPRTSERIN